MTEGSPAGPSRGLVGLSPGPDSWMDFWDSTVAKSWGCKGANPTGSPKSQPLLRISPSRLFTHMSSHTLTPSEPACRAWLPLPPLRPLATPPRLPLRSAPANTREVSGLVPTPSASPARCCLPAVASDAHERGAPDLPWLPYQ